jgi:hypothetical protein
MMMMVVMVVVVVNYLLLLLSPVFIQIPCFLINIDGLLRCQLSCRKLNIAIQAVPEVLRE